MATEIGATIGEVLDIGTF